MLRAEVARSRRPSIPGPPPVMSGGWIISYVEVCQRTSRPIVPEKGAFTDRELLPRPVPGKDLRSRWSGDLPWNIRHDRAFIAPERLPLCEAQGLRAKLEWPKQLGVSLDSQPKNAEPGVHDLLRRPGERGQCWRVSAYKPRRDVLGEQNGGEMKQ
jgi:hypothetical protein